MAPKTAIAIKIVTFFHRKIEERILEFKPLYIRFAQVKIQFDIDHILREAKLYHSHLVELENRQNPEETLKETELFWDQIMMEHALFIRGLLDPTECDLINTANDFAGEYYDLMQAAMAATDMTIGSVTDTTLQKTVKYRDFKEAGTKGINECKIRSIILPLLADHVLRESNHYIRLLRQLP